MIHLHSTFAGVYGRLFVSRYESVCYTPHCYSFEKKDVSLLKRSIYFLIEFLITILNKRVALASSCPRETYLASKFTNNIFNIYNAVIPSGRVRKPISKRTVVMVGRLCEQKGVVFFLNAKRLINSDLDIEFVWVGGGDTLKERVLLEAGVKVTGWVSNKEAHKYMTDAALYFHTALWEGLPISLLEIADFGVPILCRDAEYLYGLDQSISATSAGDAAKLINDFFVGESEVVGKLVSNQRNIKAKFTEYKLKQSLMKLYSVFK